MFAMRCLVNFDSDGLCVAKLIQFNFDLYKSLFCNVNFSLNACIMRKTIIFTSTSFVLLFVVLFLRGNFSMDKIL